MKNFLWTSESNWAAATLALCFPAAALCQTLDPWYTVDQFQYQPGQRAFARAATFDPGSGAIYVCGHADTSSGSVGLLMQSTNADASWQVIDDYLHPDSTETAYFSAAVDTAGNVYTVGYFSTTESLHPWRWLVRKYSRNDDGSFVKSTVDDTFALPADYPNHSNAEAVAADQFGNVYVAGGAIGTVGSGRKAYNAWYWVVRKSSNGGANWTSLGDPYLYAGSTTTPHAILCTPDGLFVGGTGSKDTPAGSEVHWLVRKSTDGGNSWTLVDDFLLPKQKEAHLAALACDSLGTIYAVGSAQTATVRGNPVHSWIVRKSSSAGAWGSWTTVDRYPYTATDSLRSAAEAVTFDGKGAILVAGAIFDSAGWPMRWIVRKSIDGGVNWRSSDDFAPENGTAARSYGLTVDATGNYYAAGMATDASNIARWSVRKLDARRATQ